MTWTFRCSFLTSETSEIWSLKSAALKMWFLGVLAVKALYSNARTLFAFSLGDVCSYATKALVGKIAGALAESRQWH